MIFERQRCPENFTKTLPKVYENLTKNFPLFKIHRATGSDTGLGYGIGLWDWAMRLGHITVQRNVDILYIF